MRFPGAAGRVDFGLAGAYSSVFLVVSLVLVLLYHKVNGDSRRWATVSGKAFRPRRVELGRGRYLAYALFGLFFLVTVALPLLILLWTSLTPFYQTPTLSRLSTIGWSSYTALFHDRLFLSSLKNTLVLVIVTPLATMTLAMLVSWFVIRSRNRGRFLIDAVVFFAHGIPGVVVGVAIIVAYLQQPLNTLAIYGTVAIVVVGLATHFIAYTTRVCNTAITQIHRELEEAAHVSGARQAKTIVMITLPLIRPAFISRLIWVGIHTFKALTIPLMLQTPNNQLVAVRMWTLWNQGASAKACALAVLTIVLLGAIALTARRSMERAIT